jgi:hypothetical protein
MQRFLTWIFYEVERRIAEAATRDAIVTGQAAMRAMAVASALLFSTLQYVLARRRSGAVCAKASGAS